MISLLKVYKRGGAWYVSGSSEVFETRGAALERVRTMRQPKKKKDSRKYLSEKVSGAYRSTWEVELAEVLSELGIAYEFEPQRFYFRAEKESYLPDFYLPEYNCWIEVKGYMDQRSERRIKLFRKYHRKETAFFLYEKEEREMVLKNKESLLVLIEVAMREFERENLKK